MVPGLVARMSRETPLTSLSHPAGQPIQAVSNVSSHINTQINAVKAFYLSRIENLQMIARDFF